MTDSWDILMKTENICLLKFKERRLNNLNYSEGKH